MSCCSRLCDLRYYIGIPMAIAAATVAIFYFGLIVGLAALGTLCIFAATCECIFQREHSIPEQRAVQRDECIFPREHSIPERRAVQREPSIPECNQFGSYYPRITRVGVQPSPYRPVSTPQQHDYSVRGHHHRPSVPATSLNHDFVPDVVVSGSEKDIDLEQVASMVSKDMNCSLQKVQLLIQMLKDGKTIPFMIRYRKIAVGDWSPKDMRRFKEVYENAINLVRRATAVKRNIAASGQLNEYVKNAIDNARTIAELDDIFESYKPAKTESSLSLSRDLAIATDKMLEHQHIDIQKLCDSHNDKALLTIVVTRAILRKMCNVPYRTDDWMINSVKISCQKVEDDKQNFKKYYDFQKLVRNLKADEVLAINRGEKKNILKVTLKPGNIVMAEVRQTINRTIGFACAQSPNDILKEAISAVENVLIEKISKKVREGITRSAEKTAIEVFSSNLKRLLLTPPYTSDHDFHILGIDPGMRHGCKSVIVNSKSLTVMNYFVAYLFPDRAPRDYPHSFEMILKDILKKWRVEIVVVGNGVGCKDVEKVVNNIIRSPEFRKVRYTVIPEQGVSVYSVTEEAELEYPGFTPEVISSLSLVKRFLNPLHEYVKVDPSHLGIGMYQHDIDKRILSKALQETVSEIVSMVGVDLNTASLPLLKSVSGLTSSSANAIIAHRIRRGAFKNRNELLEVEGIDYSIFEQCAGFVRIIPPLNVADRNGYNLLDQTIIHPERYESTHALLRLLGLSITNLGTPAFIERVKTGLSAGSSKISMTLGVDVGTTNLLMRALSVPLDKDIRSMATPVDLKSSMRTLDELQKGMTVSGRVDNVTTFGAFVDIGVGFPAIIFFNSHYKLDIGLGDRVEAEIDNLEVNRERISLKFKRKISDLFPMNKLI